MKREIEGRPSGRVPEEWQVTVNGVVQFTGSQERAHTVWMSLQDESAMNRWRGDQALRRILG